jgi:hypothetical protein
LQYALHLAACQLFQTGAHDGHAVQEQRNAAQQRGNVCDIHNDTPNMKLPFLSFTAHSRRNLARTAPALFRKPLTFIIPSKGASQQGLFYRKVTFFTHSATYFRAANKKISVILHTFYIQLSQMRYAAAYPASSSMASRTVSAENRNTPLPVYTST